MALAIRTSIPHTVWLDDPRAMWTAVELITDEDRRQRGRRR